MYNVQSTVYGVGVTGNYRGATYTVKCLYKAPQYLNPAL